MYPYSPRVEVTPMEQIVLGAIMMHPEGATQDDILGILAPKYAHTTVTARCTALVDKGIVYDTGERRPSKYGRPMRVLRANQVN